MPSMNITQVLWFSLWFDEQGSGRKKRQNNLLRLKANSRGLIE